MGYENPAGMVPVTLPASTGLRQFRAVTVNSAGLAAYPTGSTVGQPIIGVIQSSGTTGSTADGQMVSVMTSAPLVKWEAESSTTGPGNWVSASTVGRCQTSTNAGDGIVGLVVAGSSGGANRILTVALLPWGSTVAIA